MDLTLNGISYTLLPRAAAMVEVLIRYQHEIEQKEHGHIEIDYHAREIVVDVRVARERVQIGPQGMKSK